MSHFSPVRIFTYSFLFSVIFSVGIVSAQKRNNEFPRLSPNAKITQNIGITEVTITYGRPSVRERKIFGGLEPYGQVWRAGADEATTITFSRDVTIEGKALAAGTYGFFVIPEENSDWTIIFNKIANQWGAFAYDEKKDALRVKVKPQAADHQELLSYAFENVTAASAKAVLLWEKIRLPFTIQTATDELVRAKVQTESDTAKDWKVAYRYGLHSYYSQMYHPEALGWIEKSISLAENFDNVSLKAYLLAENKNLPEAIKAGEKAISIAKKSEKAPQGLDDFEKALNEWRSKTSAKD